MDEPDELLSIEVAAREKGCHEKSLYRAIREGRLDAESLNGRRMVRRAALAAWSPKTSGPRKVGLSPEEEQALRVQVEESLAFVLALWELHKAVNTATPEVFSVEMAAAYKECSRNAVTKAIRDGRLKARRLEIGPTVRRRRHIADRLFIQRADLDQWEIIGHRPRKRVRPSG